MARSRTLHVCRECGAAAARWAGRCNSCGEWNTLVETTYEPSRHPSGTRRAHAGGSPEAIALPRMQAAGWSPEHAVSLAEIDSGSYLATPTGIPEVDRVLSGGIVPGSVTLLGGEPGIGKSTLVLQILASLAARSVRSLLIAAEEAAEQVRQRAARLGAVRDECYVLATSDLQLALEAAGRLAPQLLVVDSVQAISDPAATGRLGSTSQVRDCAQALAHLAKATGIAVVLIGHVTKDGALAGPRTLEHLVDTVLSFEGDRHHALRFLTATKHRFGAAGELGLFEMDETGLVPVADPSAVLLADRRRGVAGTVVVPVIDGRRPLLVEVQALASGSGTSGRRVVQGVPPARLALLLAVLERSTGIALATRDVFVSTVGGIKVSEPAADLAVSLAVASASTGVPLPEGVVAFGEVGLGGELRQVPGPQRRLSEAARLGFSRAFGPPSTPRPNSGLDLVTIGTLAEAVALLGSAQTHRPGKHRRQGKGSATDGTNSFQASRAPSAEVRKGLTIVRD